MSRQRMTEANRRARNRRYLELAWDGMNRFRAWFRASREIGYPWWWNY